MHSSEHLRPESIDDSDLISITAAGHVHLELAHQDINYLAACAEDAWVEDHSLAERIRNRIAMQPYWKALSWPNTLESATDFCQYLENIQGRVGAKALFLAHNAHSPSLIRFEQLLRRIEQHRDAAGQSIQTRSASKQA